MYLCFFHTPVPYVFIKFMYFLSVSWTNINIFIDSWTFCLFHTPVNCTYVFIKFMYLLSVLWTSINTFINSCIFYLFQMYFVSVSGTSTNTFIKFMYLVSVSGTSTNSSSCSHSSQIKKCGIFIWWSSWRQKNEWSTFLRIRNSHLVRRVSTCIYFTYYLKEILFKNLQ
jgi:hypothetical protein